MNLCFQKFDSQNKILEHEKRWIWLHHQVVLRETAHQHNYRQLLISVKKFAKKNLWDTIFRHYTQQNVLPTGYIQDSSIVWMNNATEGLNLAKTFALWSGSAPLGPSNVSLTFNFLVCMNVRKRCLYPQDSLWIHDLPEIWRAVTKKLVSCNWLIFEAWFCVWFFLYNPPLFQLSTHCYWYFLNNFTHTCIQLNNSYNEK